MAQSRSNASKSSSEKNQVKYTVKPFNLLIFPHHCLPTIAWEWPRTTYCYIKQIWTSLFLTYNSFLIINNTVFFVTLTKIPNHSTVMRIFPWNEKPSDFPSLGHILPHSFHMPLMLSFSPFAFSLLLPLLMDLASLYFSCRRSSIDT